MGERLVGGGRHITPQCWYIHVFQGIVAEDQFSDLLSYIIQIRIKPKGCPVHTSFDMSDEEFYSLPKRYVCKQSQCT